MELTPEIKIKLKEREYIQNLVQDLEKDIIETKMLLKKYNKTLKFLNFELYQWDKFSNKNKY